MNIPKTPNNTRVNGYYSDTYTVPDSLFPDTTGTWLYIECNETALKNAISTASSSEPIQIRFNHKNTNQIIQLTSQMSVASRANVTIDGENRVTLDGGKKTRIIFTNSHARLTVKNLTFINGKSEKTGAESHAGGAIFSGWQGELLVENCKFYDNESKSAYGGKGGGAIYTKSGGKNVIIGCEFKGNESTLGGAIYNLLSDLIIYNTVFDSNTSEGYGGAIMTDGASCAKNGPDDGEIDQFFLGGVTFRHNSGKGQGGAFYCYLYAEDFATIDQCAFYYNAITKNDKGVALGGAIRRERKITIKNSTFAYNSSEGQGGAISSDGRTPGYIENCTFYKNETPHEGGIGGAFAGGVTSITNCTFAYNYAKHVGGALFTGDDSSIRFTNNILYNNTAGNTWKGSYHCSATMTDGGGNVQYPIAGDNDHKCTASAIIQDPLLNDLSDNDGPTETMAIPQHSPARNAGTSNNVAYDQRGKERDDSPDSGAYEWR